MSSKALNIPFVTPGRGGGGVRKVPKKCHVLFDWLLYRPIKIFIRATFLINSEPKITERGPGFQDQISI